MALGVEEATTHKPQIKQFEQVPTVHAGVAIAIALSFAFIGLYTFGRSSSPRLLDQFTRFSPGLVSSLPGYTPSNDASLHSDVAGVPAALSAHSGKSSRHDDFGELQKRQPKLPFDRNQPFAGGSQPSADNQPSVDIQPSAGDSQPSAGDSQPSAGDSQPSAGDSQSSAGDSQPSAGSPLSSDQTVNAAVPPRAPPVGLPIVTSFLPVSGGTTASPSDIASSSNSTASEASKSLPSAVPEFTPSAPFSPSSHPSAGPPPSTRPPTDPPTEPPTKPPTEPPLSDLPPAVWTRIPGSVLDSPDKIRSFRERFDCIGREGNWSHYVSPRLLPWPDEMSKCDVGHLKKSTRHVAFQDADRIVGQFQEVVSQIEEISKMGRGAPLHLLNQLRLLKRRRDELIRQWTVRESLKYFWLVPGSSTDGQDGAAASDGSSTNGSRCAGPWEWFAPDKFCQILDKRSLLIVGDSINQLLADSILYNVRLGAKDQASRVQWGEPTGYCQRYRNATKEPADKRCWTLHLCADLGFSVRIFFVRDYYLNSTEAENDFMVDKNFGESWMDDIAAQGVSIVVMNRGAHYIEDGQFERQMRSTLLALRQIYPDLLIIVRNTPAGHPHCWLHRKPLSGKLLALPHDDWHWDGFAAQNEILKRLTEGVGGVYMDVNASAVWRPDGHVGRWDCLHYCHPGPVDTWVQLLFNMLLGLLLPNR